MKDVDELCGNTIRMLSADLPDRMGSFSDCLTAKAGGCMIIGRYKS
jgi:hypothetical protein